jgi:hypothetical protein
VFACGNILIITQATFADAGKYQCILNGSESTYFTVAVFVPVTLCEPKDKVVTLRNGDNGHLDCCVLNVSYPPSKDIRWNYNDRYIASGKYLELKNFNENQTGVYECMASNNYGTPAVKKFFVVLEAVGNRSTVLPKTVSFGSDLRKTVKTVTTSESSSSSGTSQYFHPVCLFYVLPLWLD